MNSYGTDYCSHSVIIRITDHANDTEFQYSDGAAGGARGRAQAEEGAEEGAHCERQEGRAAGAPMLSAPLRIVDDLSLKDQPSLPASRFSGPVAAEHSASVHEREFEMSLFSLPVN